MERLYESDAVRKAVLLVVLALVWEGYARALNNPLLFPTLTATWRRSGRRCSRASCRGPSRTR